MIPAITAHETDQRIREVDRENLDDGEHAELVVGKRRLFVTVSQETTAVVLADEQTERQSSIVVEDDLWITR